MKKRKKARRARVAIAVLFGVLMPAAAFWYISARHPRVSSPSPDAQPNAAPAAAVAVPSDRVDPSNEGRRVLVTGVASAPKPVRDPELGIEADALVLVRVVEMRQWQETCSGTACDYALVWSGKIIDSHAFRDRAGHANATPFPFSSQRFVASAPHIGAFAIDPALLGNAAAVEYKVRLAQLPPNLAATFREQGGVLYTGNAAGAPMQGDLRVSYKIVPSAEQHLSGIQKGNHLHAR